MYAFRALLFFIKGRSSFTHSGYLTHEKTFNREDLDVDLAGQHHLITGANAGIGFETSKALAARGASVHMICRNRERGEKALQEIVQATSSKSVELHIMDVGKMSDIATFCSEYLAGGKPIHSLIHNAGCMVPWSITDEKLEQNFATNLAGPTLMTEILLPVLRKTPGSRVIFVSSGGMYSEKLEVDHPFGDDLNPFNPTRQYARNKRAQIAFTKVWASRPENAGVKFLSMHPGWADTEAVREAMPDFYKRMKDSLRTPYEGADTVIWLAAARRAVDTLPNAAFVFDRAEAPKHLALAGTAYTQQEAERMFAKVWELVRVYASQLGAVAEAAPRDSA